MGWFNRIRVWSFTIPVHPYSDLRPEAPCYPHIALEKAYGPYRLNLSSIKFIGFVLSGEARLQWTPCVAQMKEGLYPLHIA